MVTSAAYGTSEVGIDDGSVRPVTSQEFRLFQALVERECGIRLSPAKVAMLLVHRLPPQSGWTIEVLASDISTRVLEHAMAARYAIARAHEIPTDYLHHYMLQGTRTQEGRMKVGPLVRSLVEFARVNLIASEYALRGPYDLIFCRNVLIYFATSTKQRVLDHITPLLAADGLSFLGPTECLGGPDDRLRAVGPNVYAPRAASSARVWRRPSCSSVHDSADVLGQSPATGLQDAIPELYLPR